jgi:phenylacetate-CoA ligase
MQKAVDDRFLDPEEGLGRQDLWALQEKRLLSILPYAYERSGLVRTVWDAAGVHPRDIRSIDDFEAKAPFIDQDALRAYRDAHKDPMAGTLCVPVSQLAYMGSTSGTTGNPTPIAHLPHGPTEMARGRELWMMGARPGDYIAVIMFSFRSGIDMLCERAPEIGYKRIFLSQAADEVARLFQITEKFRPTVLYILSNPMIIAIDAYARKHGVNVREVFSCYRAAAYGGEALGGWARSKLEEWGLKVVNMTAAGDAMPATECLERDGSHVWEDLGLLEHLEPGSNHPAKPGERGELVMTSLTDFASPLIRFRTNDFVLVNRDLCRCGRSHARIRTLGRTGDMVQVGERKVMPSDVGPVLETIDNCRAGLFQIYIPRTPMPELGLRVGYDADQTADLPALQKTVVDVLKAALKVEVSAEMVANSELLKLGPPHKIPRTVKL